MRTSNPALSQSTFAGLRADASDQVMTIQGTVNKSFILFFLLLLGAGYTWSAPALRMPLIMPAAILGFVVAMVTVFRKEWAPVTAPVYALIEGVILGGISAYFEQSYPGIVMQAVGLTFGTLLAMLMAYKTGLIQVTDKFRLGLVAAMGGVALFYLFSIVLSFFHIQVPILYSSSPLGIGFSIIVVIIAALNLVLDFDVIDQGARLSVPKFMEWYGAFSLMVTLIWLYLEILRLLAKTRRR